MRVWMVVLFGVVSMSLSGSEHIICIHGFMRNKECMKGMELALKGEGYQVTNWHYPSRGKTIEEHAGDLVVLLNSIAKESPGQKISFVTHSLGGIITRAALNHPECPLEAKIGKAVLIGPPNRGAEFARILGQYGVVRSLLGEKAGSELVNNQGDGFDCYGEFPETVRVMVIAGTLGSQVLLKGPNDGKVLVEETRLPSKHEFVTVSAGHAWITYHPTVISKTKEFMKISKA